MDDKYKSILFRSTKIKEALPLVILNYLIYINENGIINEMQKDIALKLNMDRAAVSRSLKKLENKGFIEKSGNKKNRLYKLVF